LDEVGEASTNVIALEPGVPEMIQVIPLPCWSSLEQHDKTVVAGVTFATGIVIVLTALDVIVLTVKVPDKVNG
jgi:hypothetical protein